MMAVATNTLMPDKKRRRQPAIIIPEKGSRPTPPSLPLCFFCTISADGTHGLISNDYKVIGFGVYHIGTEGIKRFHPLAYALATGELELVSILLLHYVKCAARDLFGLNPRFKSGIISDHTEVFVNAFQESFPEDQVLQWFPHLIWKFRIEAKREGNGQYMKLLKSNQSFWLRDKAEEDVYMLRGLMMENKTWRIPSESLTWIMIHSTSGGIMYLGYLGVFHRTIHKRGRVA
jgi:hypothetical protein